MKRELDLGTHHDGSDSLPASAPLPQGPAARVLLVLKTLAGGLPALLLTLLLAAVFGESLLRLPFIPKRLVSRPDPFVGRGLAPHQQSYTELAGHSRPSPLLSINALGLRGGELAKDRLLILAPGNSEGIGLGVRDHEVWTERLQSSLDQQWPARFAVLNAAQPGHSPEFQARMLRRAIAEFPPDLILLRLTSDDLRMPILDDARVQRTFERLKEEAELGPPTLELLPYLQWRITAHLKPLMSALGRWNASKGQRPFREEELLREGLPKRFAAFEQIAALARTHSIPIVVFVQDPFGLAAWQEHRAALEAIFKDVAPMGLSFVGPTDFGLSAEQTPEDRYARYRRDLLVYGDPVHGNARHHQLYAEAVFKTLRTSPLLRSLLERR